MSKVTTEERNEVADSEFALPKERKEPIENGTHVRDRVPKG